VKRDCLEEQWKQQRGRAVYHRDKMKNDELVVIEGKYKEHIGRLQGRYRITKEEAKREVDEYAIHASTTIGLHHGSPLR
jgi:uncharacterized protein YjbJ (UPF0337 family)